MSYDQTHTPEEQGYMLGLSMAQGDLKTQGELDMLLGNYNDLNPQYRQGLMAGREEGVRLRVARREAAIQEMTRELEHAFKENKHSRSL